MPRPGLQRKRAAAAALSQAGRAEPGQLSWTRSAYMRHPAGRPHTPPALYATDIRQTEVRQHHRLMPSGWGIIVVSVEMTKCFSCYQTCSNGRTHKYCM